jgi:hypothetical protein
MVRSEGEEEWVGQTASLCLSRAKRNLAGLCLEGTRLDLPRLVVVNAAIEAIMTDHHAPLSSGFNSNSYPARQGTQADAGRSGTPLQSTRGTTGIEQYPSVP